MTAPSAWTIQQVMSIATNAARRLEADGTLDEDGAALFAECPDAETMLVRVLRAMDEAASNADAVNVRITDLDMRWKRFKRQRDELRGVAFAIMEALNIAKFKHPEFTVSVQAGRPGVVVTDAEALPTEYVRVETSPDMTKIKAALARGETIPGAELSNAAPVLTVRTK